MPFLTGITFKSFGKRPFRLKKIKAIVTATGGTILTPGNGFRYHTFTSPGTFYVTDGSGPFELLVVGGGGAHGGSNGGGGGGGGVRYITNIPTSPGTSHPISIGAGGGPSSPYPTSGNPSTFGHPGGPYVSLGGGRGGTYTQNNALPGGCGGGGSGYYSGSYFPGGYGSFQHTTGMDPTWGTPVPPQGYPGGQGNGAAPGYGTGGGGGSAGPGSPGTSTNSGNGGPALYFSAFTAPLIGVPLLVPISGRFGGGGGGTATSGGAPAGSPVFIPSAPGCGGGGGGETEPSGLPGIIVVRYQYEV